MAKRQYNNEYPSVTTILGVLRKIGLEMWFKFNTAKFCNEESKRGREAGTDIHKAIEQYILTGEASISTEYNEEVMNGLNSFILFRKENPELKLTLSEVPLTSEKYGYNGTIDAPSPPRLFDWKGGNCKDKEKPPIYDEMKYQVASYVRLWNENNIRTPDKFINEAYIVVLAKDKVAYNLYKMDEQEIEDCFTQAFLPALKIYNYQRTTKTKGKQT